MKIECQTQLNENMQSLSELKLQTANKIEQTEGKSNKQIINKNFLKLKFRNKSNQSQSIQIRKSSNKKLIRTIKKTESSSSPDDNLNEKEVKTSISTKEEKEKSNVPASKESDLKTSSDENENGKLLIVEDSVNDETLNNNEIIENSVQLPLDLSVQKI